MISFPELGKINPSFIFGKVFEEDLWGYSVRKKDANYKAVPNAMVAEADMIGRHFELK
jgi:hypothetical protein